MSVSTSSTSLSPLSRRNNQFDPIKSMKASLLGLMNVLGLSRRILARFLQTFNSKVYGVPTVLPQPGPYLYHVQEVDTVAEVLRPLWKTMPVDAEGFIEIRSLRYLAHQYLFSQASSSKFRIVQSSSWDVVDLSLRVPNFDRRDSCMNWTVGHSRRVVHNTALQHVIFNAESTIIERMSCVQCRRSQVSSSSLFHFHP